MAQYFTPFQLYLLDSATRNVDTETVTSGDKIMSAVLCATQRKRHLRFGDVDVFLRPHWNVEQQVDQSYRTPLF